MSALSWVKLLTPLRQRPTTAPEGHRNAFEQDYDRIVGSSSVRRLQDKAQVFPLQENDFTRTRLTHSIEVSAVAKSLGKAVGRKIQEQDTSFMGTDTEKLTALLQTVGLIHDLGNPPFGHYGETIIREWFKSFMEGQGSSISLTEEQKKDFLHFDGNVQDLRIVAKLQMLNDEFGVGFTYATLASLMKYPWSSSTTPVAGKYGYYLSESKLVHDIWEATGLSEGIRHPATFLLEAADDIVYICDDIEDGVKKELIDWPPLLQKIRNDFSGEFYSPMFERFDKISSKMRYDIPEHTLASVLNFKNIAQGFMFNYAVENFMQNYTAIMDGHFGIKELLKIGEIERLHKYLKDIAKEHCFNSREVITLELIGDTVIKGLFNFFIQAMFKEVDENSAKKYEEKLYILISSNFKYIAKFDYDKGEVRSFSQLSTYEKMQLVTDYISGMTDSYAVKLYRELTGTKLP